MLYVLIGILVLIAVLIGIAQAGSGAAGMGQDSIIVLADVVEHGPGGTDGTDGLHLG